MFTKLLDPKESAAFKGLFGTEKNKDILISFLNDMFTLNKRPMINDVTFLNTSCDDEKLGVVDILVNDEDKNQYIIELQFAGTAGFEKNLDEILLRQKDDHELKEVVCITFLNFIMFPKSENYRVEHGPLDSEGKKFSNTYFELPKFQKKVAELSNTAEKWMYFLKYANESSIEDLLSLIGQDWILEKACGELMTKEEQFVLRNTVSAK